MTEKESGTDVIDVGLVLSGHVASCPRAVKFADALSDRGYTVRVFAIQHSEWVSELDRALLAERSWSATLVRHPMGLHRKVQAAKQRLALAAWRYGFRTDSVAKSSESRWVRPLVSAARAFKPRMWIGFNVPGILAVDHLAAQSGAHCVIDVEDDHVGILPNSLVAERKRLERLMQPALRRATHRISTSKEMGEALTRRYGVDFQIIHNVPLFDETAAVSPAGRRRSLYWCSQTVGPDRGLEEFLPVFAKLPGDVSMVLLGRVDDEFRRDYLARAARIDVPPQRIVFQPPVLPGQMMASASPNLMGLALENNLTENHQYCLTNKIFDYLAVGLPVVFSETQSQSRLAAELGDAACLIDYHRPEESAARIRALLDDPGRYERASAAALSAARNRYCWQVEREYLISGLAPLLGSAE